METIELCELRGFGTNVNGKVIRCSNAPDRHHLINRSKFKRGSDVEKYINKHEEIFYSDVCSIHNRDKWADQPAARRILLGHKRDLYGVEYVKPIVDEIPWKVQPPELSYDGIMACPLP